MTINDETICQEALSFLRQEVALTPGFSDAGYSGTRTKAEAACRRAYDYSRRAFLAAHDWNFARRRVAFAAVGGTMAKPADCLRVIDVLDGDGVTRRWRLDGTTIEADESAATLVYTADTDDVTAWPPLARAAFAVYLAREMCIPITGRQEDLKAIDALANQRMQSAQMADLYEGDGNDDFQRDILARLLDGRGGEDNFNVAAYVRRINSVRRTVLNAITEAHDWGATYAHESELPGDLKEVFVLGVCAALAATVGATGERAATFRTAYDDLLAKARVKSLHQKLAANSDPILSELVGNFRIDDAALVPLFDTYTARVNSVKDDVRDALLALHHWNFARKRVAFTAVDGAMEKPDDLIRVVDVRNADGGREPWSVVGSSIEAGEDAATLVYTARMEVEKWPALAKEAYVSAVAAKLSAVMAPTPQLKSTMERIAAERLTAARVSDINEDGSGVAIVREVMTVIKSSVRAGDGDLEESSDAIANRIADLFDGARAEVMAAHPWNFALASIRVVAFGGPGGEQMVVRPPDAVRIVAVKTPSGDLADWCVRGSMIVARQPIAEVTYIRDEEDVDDWPPLVRRALVYRLAVDASVSVPTRDKDPRGLLQLYEEKLRDASLADARESNPGRAAWGHGSFVAAMRGGKGPLTRIYTRRAP